MVSAYIQHNTDWNQLIQSFENELVFVCRCAWEKLVPDQTHQPGKAFLIHNLQSCF